MDANAPRPGDRYAVERTFTTEDVRRFAELSGDAQPRHVEPGDDGRLMVQGLLTATLPTSIGGDLEVLAHTMEFVFHRPVHTGETIRCTWTVEEVEERDDRYDLAGRIDCRNGSDDEVMTGSVSGLIRK